MEKVYIEFTDQDKIDLLWRILVWCVEQCVMDHDDLVQVNKWIARLEDLRGVFDEEGEE